MFNLRTLSVILERPISSSIIVGKLSSVGTATSNIYGTYSLTWTPDIPGDFTVIATFAGSNSYYQSSAATAFYASSPATHEQTTAPATDFATQSTLVNSAIAIIIVIIIIGAVLAVLMMRKKALYG